METPAVRIAQPSDLRFVRSLARTFTNQIGFIPDAATERELHRRNILLGELNNAEAGFLLTLPTLASQPTTAAIIQTAVHLDAQRNAVGLALVAEAAATAKANGALILQAWCRSDLEANDFWRAAGFAAIAARPGGNAHAQNHTLWRLALHENADLRALPRDQYARAPGGKFTTREKAVHAQLT